MLCRGTADIAATNDGPPCRMGGLTSRESSLVVASAPAVPPVGPREVAAAVHPRSSRQWSPREAAAWAAFAKTDDAVDRAGLFPRNGLAGR